LKQNKDLASTRSPHTDGFSLTAREPRYSTVKVTVKVRGPDD
jgi:hypothetical protein